MIPITTLGTTSDDLSMMSPYLLVLIAVVAAMLFAPHLLPKLGRILGRLARKEIERRTLPGIGRLSSHVNNIAELSKTVAQVSKQPESMQQSREATMPVVVTDSVPEVKPIEENRNVRRHKPSSVYTGIILAIACVAVGFLLLRSQ